MGIRFTQPLHFCDNCSHTFLSHKRTLLWRKLMIRSFEHLLRSLRPVLMKLEHFENVQDVYEKRRNFQNLMGMVKEISYIKISILKPPLWLQDLLSIQMIYKFIFNIFLTNKCLVLKWWQNRSNITDFSHSQHLIFVSRNFFISCFPRHFLMWRIRDDGRSSLRLHFEQTNS